MNYETIKNKLAKLGNENASTFDVLQGINAIVNISNSEWEGRDLVIRALDKFNLFDAVEQSLLLRAANKTLLASLPDLAVLLVLSAVVRLARIAALGFVSHS